MFEVKPDPIRFAYGGALYVKDDKGSVRFTGYGTDTTDQCEKVSLSDADIDVRSVKDTPLWNLIYNPDFDISTIRISSGLVKIKKYFLRENDNSVVFLFGNKVFIRIIITNGDISEYERLPSRTYYKEGATVIAWLCSNKQNIELYYKRVQEG